MPIGELIQALQKSGLEVDFELLRDLLWLAPQINRTVDAVSEPPLQRTQEPLAKTLPQPPAEAPRLPEDTDARAPGAATEVDGPSLYGRVGGRGGALARSVLLRGAPALPDATAIGRALRPLSRRRAGHLLELDERAPAEFIAETGAKVPVWQPSQERWFDIVLAVEEVPSLAAWRPLVAEFERLLQRQGGFRDLKSVLLRVDAKQVKTFDRDGREAPERALQERSGRRIVLVVSDCTSTAWRSGQMGAWMQRIALRSPLAVVQLLPQSLWPNTAIGFADLHARSPRMGAPAAQLQLRLPSWAVDEPGIAVPVLALNPVAVGAWARMMTAAGHAWGTAALLPLPGEDVDEMDGGLGAGGGDEPSADQRAASFRASAKPDAQRLAAYFSVVRPLTPPVMRVIQRAMSPESAAAALAQVFLGGLLRPVVAAESYSAMDDIEYDFYPGLRELLAGSLTRGDFVSVNLALHEYLQQQTGTSFDFFALLEDPGGTEQLPEAALPFVQASRDFARRFGGRGGRTAAQAPVESGPMGTLVINLQGKRLTFQHSSARGVSTVHQDLPDEAAGILARVLEGGGEAEMQRLADLVLPRGLQDGNAFTGGPTLLELVVDEAATPYPWEALIRSEREGEPPLAVARGLTRRSDPASFGELAAGTARSPSAVVIGDPSNDPSFPALAGAREEAEKVSMLLRAVPSLDDVRTLIAAGAKENFDQLLSTELRVLHVASHSMRRSPEEQDMGRRVEIVLGNGVGLGLREFAALKRVPELIFLGTQYAASMAPELLRMGARAVVAPFGSVDDKLASEFAVAFFQSLAQGANLIQATRKARAYCWETDTTNDMWGRFQCFGDPFWRLIDRQDVAAVSNVVEAAAATAPEQPIPPVESNTESVVEPVTQEPDPGSAPIRGWVLVAGTGSSRLSNKLLRTAEALGAALARSGYGLVTGGWPGVDEAVARRFAEELRLAHPDLDVDTRLTHIVGRGKRPDYAGSVVEIDNKDAEYDESIRRANYVVLIGGVGGTWEVALRAERAGRTVLPLADTGGDASRIHKRLKSAWETSEKPPRESVKPKLTASDLIALANPTPEAVASLISVLNRLTLSERTIPAIEDADLAAELPKKKPNKKKPKPAAQFIDSPAGLPDPFVTDWTDHPQRGARAVPFAVSVGLHRYQYGVYGQALSITIDVDGGPMQISRCDRAAFNGNFGTADGVLLGDSRAGLMPVHLSFDPPLRSVGAHVSAIGTFGRRYRAVLNVRCSDGSSAMFTVDGVLSHQRNTAPFAGVVAPAGVGIAEIWFDAVPADSREPFASVAINNLIWEP
ncbi:MAG: CHAT domain-containing protein [Burkholderiales bacterium]|nr:CHAT domain-containing protein [Burkholderiales bacterium]